MIADRLLLGTLYLTKGLLLPWPMSLRIRIAGVVGMLVGLLSKRHQLALLNLKRAFGQEVSLPELKRIRLHTYRDMAKSLVEFLFFADLDQEYFDQHVTIQGIENLNQSLAQGKGVVILTGHFGNWELMNLMSGLLGYRSAVLVKPQKLKKSDAYLNELRTLKGARVVMRGMGVRELYRTLRSGGLIGVLADQDGGKAGAFVPLFGRQTSYPRGLARFANRCGSTALPVFVSRDGNDHHRIQLGDPIRANPDEAESKHEQRIVESFSHQFEMAIRRSPSQWLWPHRRWKSSPHRDVVILSDGRKGHLHQSNAMAQRVVYERTRCNERMKSETPIRTLPVVFRNRTWRSVVTLYGILTRGGLWGGMKLLSYALTKSSYGTISTAAADVVISCGTATEGVNLILSKVCEARSCYIHKPQYGGRHFSTVILPAHDRFSAGASIGHTLGALSFVNPQRLNEIRKEARAELGLSPEQRVLTLLVGGPSKHGPWNPRYLEICFKRLKTLCTEKQLKILVTASPRTDTAVEDLLERIFSKESMCAKLVIPNQSNPAGVYEKMLACADQVWVTADSISMVSEAISTRKPVGLLMGDDQKILKGKIARFVQAIEKDHAGQLLKPSQYEEFLMSDHTKQFTAQADPLQASAALLAK